MKFALFAQLYKPEYKETLLSIFHQISELNGEMVFEENFYNTLIDNKIIDQKCVTFSSKTDLPEHIDYFISIGGDGTMLRAANFVKCKNIPLVGINAGRLGFLANVQETNIKGLIKRLHDKNYHLSERTLLKIDEPLKAIQLLEPRFALNEITIARKNTTSMITVDIYVDDEFLATYWADGIIISTPTGSTGYSLSCGGPIITPSSKCLVITPIAPHNLTTRPLIIDDHCVLTMRVQSREKEFLLSMDSASVTLDTENEIKISLAEHTLHLVEFSDVTFLKTLRNKLLWGEDKRN